MKYHIYTDGSTATNPGLGAWCALIEGAEGGVRTVLTGRARPTTSNRMEMEAVIQGLRLILSSSAEIEVFTDSRYVIDNVDKKDIRTNTDLWEQLREELEGRTVTFTWVKGHSGHPENTFCDFLARWLVQNPQENQHYPVDPSMKHVAL